MLGSILSMWLRYGLSRRQAAVVTVGAVALVVGVGLAVQAGLFGSEVVAGGEVDLELGNVTSSGGESTNKTGP